MKTKPNMLVRATKDIAIDGMTYPKDIEFEIHIKWVLGGIVTIDLGDGRTMDLYDERMLDHNIDFVREL